MRALASILALSLTSSAAAAQTTNCQRVGTGVQCNTISSPTIPDTSARDQQTFQSGIGALAGAIQSRRHQKEVQRTVNQIETLILSGQCDEAIALTAAKGTPSDVEVVRAVVKVKCVSPEQTMMAQASAAVSDGRCDEARSIALAASRLDVADQAMRVCVAK